MLNNNLLYVCNTFCFSIYVNGHLGRFYTLAFLNNGAMNLGLQIFLKDSALLKSSSFSISSPTHVIFWCGFLCSFVLMVASYLDGCEVIAFYFYPVWIVVLAREVGKSCSFSLRVEITWSSVSRWILFMNGKLTRMLKLQLVNGREDWSNL